jgi:uncharacterized protein YcfL
MKKITLTLLGLCVVAQVLTSCSSNKKEEDQTDSTTTTAVVTETTAPATEQPANAPLSYKVTAMPDSAILGKDREALVKVSDINVVELVNADGKPTGSELTIKLSITNKSTLDVKKFFTVEAANARLELDNKVSIPSSGSDGNSSPEPESTSEAIWKFTLPPSTKPAKLNFFMSGTRVSVNLASKS